MLRCAVLFSLKSTMAAWVTGFPLGPYALLAPIGIGRRGEDELLLWNAECHGYGPSEIADGCTQRVVAVASACPHRYSSESSGPENDTMYSNGSPPVSCCAQGGFCRCSVPRFLRRRGHRSDDGPQEENARTGAGVSRRPGVAEAIAEPLDRRRGSWRRRGWARSRLDHTSAVHSAAERNAIDLACRTAGPRVRSRRDARLVVGRPGTGL